MPSHLAGLNEIHSPPSAADHDLLNVPDLSAQLDLWTNLAFQNDDSPVLEKRDFAEKDSSEEDENELHGIDAAAAALRDGHSNVITGTDLGSNVPRYQPEPQFDLNALLANFPANYSFQYPPVPPPQPLPQEQYAPAPPPAQQPITIAQLLALQNFSSSMPPSMPPAPAPTPAPEQPPAAKRQRTRRSSEEMSPVSPPSDLTPVSASEDKRKRNTAASARFRQKKKEREAALEGKAKELETRVNELERECEGLRRENGWLKGLVVGVTGVAAPPVMTPALSSGAKRTREDDA
ncbi:hypothetical protein BD626DRAFT_24490 [Schizophyllum amplum]|uniref:BZIP domain-containing protein n=1 Tax=Schizophyllum amplum TaxID=97359 RepID=A0A550CZD9_9AGAR|nr:hypothetical protein BD626DRAFT_24490 [Auriculariopsis ampla]